MAYRRLAIVGAVLALRASTVVAAESSKKKKIDSQKMNMLSAMSRKPKMKKRYAMMDGKGSGKGKKGSCDGKGKGNGKGSSRGSDKGSGTSSGKGGSKGNGKGSGQNECEDVDPPPEFCFSATDPSCGPDSWPNLPIDNNECGGDRSSPVMITTSETCEAVDYFFDAGACTYDNLQYEITDHTLVAKYPDDCIHPNVTVGDLMYEVDEWHYHLGTEHSIDSEYTTGSIQILHSLVNGDMFAEPFMILGLGVTSGNVDGVNDPVVDRMLGGFVDQAFQVATACDLPCGPSLFWEGVPAPSEIANPYAVLPDRPKFYQYLGGRTTPPCTEDVFWNFMSEYVTVSIGQQNAISRLLLSFIHPDTCKFGTIADPTSGSTSRPPLNLNGRPISLAGLCDGTED